MSDEWMSRLLLVMYRLALGMTILLALAMMIYVGGGILYNLGDALVIIGVLTLILVVGYAIGTVAEIILSGADL